MSRAVERLGGNVIPLRSVPTASLRLISVFTDIGQGAGLATTSGARPFLAVIATGVLAHEDVGIDFTGTDWAWMESWIFIGILAALFIAFWVMDREGRSERIRPGGRAMEAATPYQVSCAIAGALLFAGSLADGGETSWPGLVAGAVVGLIGYLALGRLFMRANQRLLAAGDPGILLGIARDLLTIVLTVAVVLADVIGYVVFVAALVLILMARRREGEKYEGLRVLR
jgi:Domain of unknown function (DUF4126)